MERVLNISGHARAAPVIERGDRPAPSLNLRLLGGFHVEVGGILLSESAWQQRRTGKALIKLLSITPGHAVHRDQVLDTFWPDADPESAANSLSKALHAARRALEPHLPARGQSSYIRLKNDVLILDTENVWIDVSHFRRLSAEALRIGDDLNAYEKALAAYTGELLPEDRYESWVAEHSAALTDLTVQLLVAGADLLEAQREHGQAIDWLRRVLQYDETREDVHRRLMHLYMEIGSRHQALRQYQECRDILYRELDVEPDLETEQLYQDIRANRIEKGAPIVQLDAEPGEMPPALAMWRSLTTPLVGRDRVLQRLNDEMTRAEQGNGGMVLISGEAGVGKTRVIARFVEQVLHRGILVLWGSNSVDSQLMPYGPFVEALENYVSKRSIEERVALAERYPELVRLVPSLAHGSQISAVPPGADFDRTHLFPAIVRLLTDLAWQRPLLLVLGDLQAADSATIQLLQYLARLAIQRRWLVVGTYREEDMGPRSELRKMLRSTSMDLFWRTIELRCLARQDCDELVSALLPGGDVNEGILEHIYALSLGNPLFIEELIRTVRERDELTLVDGTWNLSPSSRRVSRQVRNLVEDSVSHLDEDVQRVLTLAATAGMEFSFEELQRAASALKPPIVDGALLQALDQGLESRILEERGHCYAFRHPLFRAALREHLSAHRRAEFQAALASSREERAPNHIVEDLEETLQRAHDLPPTSAASAYGALVDQLDGLDRVAESARARELLAHALMNGGRYARALHVLGQAETIYRSTGDSVGLTRVASQHELVRARQNGHAARD